MCIFLREKVIILIAFFWFLINGSRYFLSAEPYTVSPIVKYACMKVKYRFLRAFMFNVFFVILLGYPIFYRFWNVNIEYVMTNLDFHLS